LRRIIRGSVKCWLTYPENAGIDIFHNGPVILPEACVRMAWASAAAFWGGLAASDDGGEGEDCEELGDGFHVSRGRRCEETAARNRVKRHRQFGHEDHPRTLASKLIAGSMQLPSYFGLRTKAIGL
jgi:hypothetical protein